jgi:hypothetical protein
MGAAWAWDGIVNPRRPHCVNQMGKTHSKPLAARHVMCELAFRGSSAVVGIKRYFRLRFIVTVVTFREGT